MAGLGLPVEKSTTSFWREKPHKLDIYRSTPHLPSKADVVVIGAGYAGASTVYHIHKICKEKGIKPPSILILEAREACSGATGRNGGHLKPDPFNRPAQIAKTHGYQAASELAHFEVAHVRAIKKVVEDEKIDCDFVMTRCCDVTLTEPMFEQMRSGMELLKKNGVSTVDDIHVSVGKEAEQHSGIKGAKGCITFTTGYLWPYKFVLGLLSRAVEQGVNLQTHTPVTAVARDPDSDGWLTVSTRRGDVRAGKVVYATNAYTQTVLPEYKGRIVPVRGICSRITAPQAPSPTLTNSYIIRWSPIDYEYLIPRLDGSIIVGGARSQYYRELDSWYNNVNDDKLIDTAEHYFDGYMQRVFHGWQRSGAKTSKVWTGIMGYSADGLPHVGAVPNKSNQFMLAGFTGHGMPQVFLCAKGIASMIVDGASFGETGVPSCFEASQTRLGSTTNMTLDAWKTGRSSLPKL